MLKMLGASVKGSVAGRTGARDLCAPGLDGRRIREIQIRFPSQLDVWIDLCPIDVQVTTALRSSSV